MSPELILIAIPLAVALAAYAWHRSERRQNVTIELTEVALDRHGNFKDRGLIRVRCGDIRKVLQRRGHTVLKVKRDKIMVRQSREEIKRRFDEARAKV